MAHRHDGWAIPYLPTPEEIREECRAIQAEWTPEKEAERRMPTRPWFPPGMDRTERFPTDEDE
jgi:hypothetical protein